MTCPLCYPGCYYYTDSCFRQDCKQTNNATKPLTKAPESCYTIKTEKNE